MMITPVRNTISSPNQVIAEDHSRSTLQLAIQHLWKGPVQMSSFPYQQVELLSPFDWRAGLSSEEVQKALPFMQGLYRRQDCLDLLQAIQGFFLREELLSPLCQLLQGFRNVKRKIEVVRKVASFSPEEQKPVLQAILPYVHELFKGNGVIGLLETIHSIPSLQRTLLLDQAAFLLHEEPSGEEKARLLKLILLSPEHCREAIIPLMRGVRGKAGLAKIVQAVQKVPSNQRMHVVTLIAPLVSRMSIDRKIEALKVMRGIAKDRRQEVIPFLEVTDVQDWAFVIRSVQKTAQGVRTSLLSLLQLATVDKIACLKAIKQVPLRQQESVLQVALIVLQVRKMSVEKLLITLCVIPPQKREEVALFLIKEKDSSQNILARVFQAHPEWKELSRLHLQAILEEEISSKEMMIQWANFIVHSQSLFGVDEETPLFQKVMSILLALESSMQSSPKNPYVLYQRLLDTHKKEALWTGPFKGPMRLSLARLQHRDPKVPFIKKDLPKEIPLQGFKPLVASLQERLEENEELKEKIQTLYGASLNELQANLLHGDLIVHLLQLPIEEADSIQEMTFYLYNILSYLWQLDGSYSAQELFSPQEEELLQFASMLNCCETGQKEAIVFYYNHLPMKNRVGPLAKTSCQEKRALFVENAVDASLHKVFAEEGFLRSLAKKEKVQEQIHQTLYLKNRLTKQVGLLMPVCFDLYAEMIDNEIVRAPLATLMTTFFQFFTEGKLVKQLQEDFLGAREFCLPVREIFELVCYEQAQEALRESSFKEDLAFLQKQADYVLQTHLAKDWEIPPSLQERYKEVSLQKKQLDQLVKEHLLSLVVEEQDAFVKDLQELPVTDFSLSVQELLDILEKERGAYLCKQWLASLQDLPKEVSLQEHLDHHLVEEPLRSYLALLDAKRSLGYYQRLLASKRIHAPAAFVLLDRLSQLQDRGQSVQELLYALSQHSMHLSLSSYLQSASGLSPELKEHLGFYQRQEDLPVFQLMRMLEKKETQSNEAYRRDLFAFLEDRSALMKKWLLENQLTEEGALFLLKEQGYVV